MELLQLILGYPKESEGDEDSTELEVSTDSPDIYRKSSIPTPYDVTIRINSLVALSTSGWEIVLGNSASEIQSNSSIPKDNRGVIVAVLGSYNRGKSFLLNELCGLNLPSGNLIHTEGISITAGRKQAENIVFIDTAGTDTAIQ
ncbi:unnamed protein product, partial [Rotaria magnacalcarata]